MTFYLRNLLLLTCRVPVFDFLMIYGLNFGMFLQVILYDIDDH